jgi:hypothetical protein
VLLLHAGVKGEFIADLFDDFAITRLVPLEEALNGAVVVLEKFDCVGHFGSFVPGCLQC